MTVPPPGGYPPPPPLPYQGGPAQPPPPVPAPRTNWWAIVALIFGLIGAILVGLVCGVVGLTKARTYGSGRGMAIAGIVLSVLWAIVAAVALVVAVSSDTVEATNVELGDCLQEIPAGDRVVNVTTVGCDEPHAGEVFAVLTVPDGDFPGSAAIQAHQEKCGPELQRYAPQAATDDSVRLYVLYPTAETWADGDRTVTCIATFNPPRTGSLRG
ncbi:DUF4190 domain-containing protein [Mycobacterium sp. NAZ190054]|uniref:DUF4190 domain-containing protein n=1 Tax=Mycobacterium sp. NAZ190054 TaxID=1747766 RepID=UPI00079C830B|nr:DUF4190 domain-containing protein [Mycobacterium sp. NAZ190054]KWX67337.1 hypothetical protein ASJ79_22045 [Mycobacterium sp. NAZ190054]